MKLLILLTVLLSISLSADAQVITTIAGNGIMGDSGDYGAATSAEISEPYACAFDSHGNLLFSEVVGNRIRKVSPAGVITTYAGTGFGGFSGDGGAATLAELDDPTGIAVDGSDNVFIVDKLNQRVRRVDAISGIITTVAGNGIAGYGGDNVLADTTMLNAPQDICFDSIGNLLILDVGNLRIRKIDTEGFITTIAGNGINGYSGDNGPATLAEIQDMAGICVDKIGNVYYSQIFNYVIRKISASGIISTIAGNGSMGPSGDGMPATDAALDPIRLAFDDTGNLYISCYLNNDVRKIDTNGMIHTIAGIGTEGFSGDGGRADAAQLHIPIGVSFDQCGNFYIADEDNNRIRKVAFYPSCELDSVGALDTTGTLSVAAHGPSNEMPQVYPNPIDDELHVQAQVPAQSVTIINALGNTVYRSANYSSFYTINTSGYPAGIYLVLITDYDGRRYIEKVIKD